MKIFAIVFLVIASCLTYVAMDYEDFGVVLWNVIPLLVPAGTFVTLPFIDHISREFP